MFKPKFTDLAGNLYRTRLGAALAQYIWFTKDAIDSGDYVPAAGIILGSPVFFWACYSDTKNQDAFTYVKKLDPMI